MIQYHNFTAENLLVEPARVKPAAIRRRGEPSSKWLVVRNPFFRHSILLLISTFSFAGLNTETNGFVEMMICLGQYLYIFPALFDFVESLLNGCQIADVDWEEIQRIAISQIVSTDKQEILLRTQTADLSLHFLYPQDETAYTYEIWHIDSEYLIEGLKERARSTVPAPGEIGNMHEPYMRDLQLRSDAYRSRLHLIHVWQNLSPLLSIASLTSLHFSSFDL